MLLDKRASACAEVSTGVSLASAVSDCPLSQVTAILGHSAVSLAKGHLSLACRQFRPPSSIQLHLTNWPFCMWPVGRTRLHILFGSRVGGSIL